MVFQIRGEQFDGHGRRMFGNKRGKVFVEDANDQADEEWHQFLRRRAERKAAALKATETSLLAMGSA